MSRRLCPGRCAPGAGAGPGPWPPGPRGDVLVLQAASEGLGSRRGNSSLVGGPEGLGPTVVENRQPPHRCRSGSGRAWSPMRVEFGGDPDIVADGRGFRAWVLVGAVRTDQTLSEFGRWSRGGSRRWGRANRARCSSSRKPGWDVEKRTSAWPPSGKGLAFQPCRSWRR